MPLLRYFSMLLVAVFLTACGGGGSIEKESNNLGGGDSGGNGIYTLSLTAAVSKDGELTSSTTLSPDAPLIVIAKLKKDGEPLSNGSISFSVGDIASMSPSDGEVVTDANGEAKVTLTPTSLVGQGTITANYTLGEQTLESQLLFTSEGRLQLTLSSVNSVTQQPSNTITAAEPLSVIASLKKDGVALANSLVLFETGQFASMEPSSGSVLTNSEGMATINLKVTSAVGAGQVTATYLEGDITTSATLNYQSLGGGDNDNGTASAKLDTMLLVDCPSGWDSNREQAEIDPIAEGCSQVNQVSSNETAEIFIKLSSSQTSDGIANALIAAQTTLGNILPSTGTALTDNFGIAILKFQPGNQGGAGTISISSPDYADVTDSVNFNIGVAQLNVAIDNGLVDSNGVQRSLSAGGSTVITVTLTDEEGNLINSALEVAFSSSCSQAEPALAELDEMVTTSNGIARSTYRAKGCQGEDRISVTIQNGSSPINEETTIVVDSAQAQSLQFLPEEDGFVSFIALPPGEGGALTQSVVSFKLVDEDNLAIPRARVDFRLSDEQGLASLTQLTGNTNADGVIRTTVQSGVVPGPLVVGACYIPESEIPAEGDEFKEVTCWNDVAETCNDTDPDNDDVRCPDGKMKLIPLSEQIFSVSSQLILSSGVTDQDTFDAAPDIINSNSYNYSGVTTNITLFFGDQFNHFNADGVAATVIAEFGAIGSLDSSDTYDCRTNKATCSVVWRSQGERPFSDPKWGNRINDIPPRVRANLTGNETDEELDEKRNCNLYFDRPAPCIEGLKRQKNAPSTGTDPDADERVVMGGRVGILAFVKGQESHRDEESSDGVQRRNGLFDVGEYRQEFDLTEAILDTNENGRFDKEDCDASPTTGPCTPVNTKNGGHDDWWIDANNNGIFDYDANNDGVPGDGKYNGLLCSQEALEQGQCNRELVNVYRNFELIMSQDDAYVRFAVKKDEAKDMGLDEGELRSCQDVVDDPDSNTSVTLLELEESDTGDFCDIKSINLEDTGNDNDVSQVRVYMFISDINGNPLPAGTEVEISTTNGELASGSISSSVGNTNTDKPLEYSVLLVRETEPNNKKVGELSIKFTYPAIGDDDERKEQRLGITVKDAG